MPSNIIKVNNGGKGFVWNVPDSKMDELMNHLNSNGDPYEETPCPHERTLKVMPIPITNNELDYDKMLDTVQTIVNQSVGFGWDEALICIDCCKVLEHNEVFISDPECSHEIEHGEFECGKCKLNIQKSDEYTRVRIDGKYDFFFNLDGSFDGIGIDMPDEKEREEFRKQMMKDESPVETVTKGPDYYVKTHR